MDQLAQRLQQERVRRGLSTFDLAQKTKIREPYIQALELSTYNVLPAVYVRSFIRTLGAELGIPASEINRLITQCLDGEGSAPQKRGVFDASADSKGQAPTNQPEADVLATLTSDANRLLTAARGWIAPNGTWDVRRLVIIAMCAVALGALFWWIFQSSDTPEPGAIPEEIVDVSDAEPQDSLILTAIARDTAELTVTMDGVRYQKFIIFPETEYRWSAMKRFTVSNIFNAGAIQFSRNGTQLPIYGRRGEVLRELVITRTEVTASNSSTKMVTPPANPELARRDSIIEQRKRDSIRSVRQQERLQRKLEQRKSAIAKRKSAETRQGRSSGKKRPEAKITKTPPRSVR
jgi:hypothetical protein